jgi:phospholipase/lecithinase/hemolysin
MYWTFILLVCFSVTFALQVNFGPPLSVLSNRFGNAAIFGDSTSDTGNVYDLTIFTWPISPPYYIGRYCNGPNWADDLNVLVKYNYAYGSATTDNNFVPGYAKLNTVLVPGILQQVNQYLTDFQFSGAIPNTVHIIWGGANDAIAKPALAATPQLIVQSLMQSVTTLLAGHAKTIIVFNQEPFQNIPQNSELNELAQFTYLTTVVNNLISESLQTIQAANPSASIYLFDLHSLITNLLLNPPSPVTNTVGFCWNAVNTATVGIYCSDANTYFFVDKFHFSAPVQQALAAAVSQFFQSGFSPSPSNYFYAY